MSFTGEKKNGNIIKTTQLKKKKLPENYFFKKVIKIPIYFGNFIIIFSNDKEKVGALTKIKSSEMCELYAHTFCNFIYGGQESFCVCFNFWDESPITIGTIMHEINHAGNRLLSAREFERDWWNDEAECYLKGWMADQVESFMRACNIV